MQPWWPVRLVEIQIAGVFHRFLVCQRAFRGWRRCLLHLLGRWLRAKLLDEWLDLIPLAVDHVQFLLQFARFLLRPLRSSISLAFGRSFAL